MRDDGVEPTMANDWSEEEVPNHADTMLVLMKAMCERLTLMVINR